ncbi:MAG: phosphate starvation-inducible protein PsiF [Curvibacter sp.]|nr:MAG: phosphate starvation-inducible protein PsiF [Curvibacter sp.]
MKQLISLVALGLALAVGGAHAAEEKAPTAQQNKMKTCNADAKTKALAGDERKAFMKDCLSAKPAGSAADAGTTQQNKMKTCNADAKTKALAGDERKAFMKECLSAK